MAIVREQEFGAPSSNKISVGEQSVKKLRKLKGEIER